MKKTQKTDLRSKSAADLAKDADGLRQQMLRARMTAAIEGKPRGVQYRIMRRQIARIETILSQKAASK